MTGTDADKEAFYRYLEEQRVVYEEAKKTQDEFNKKLAEMGKYSPNGLVSSYGPLKTTQPEGLCIPGKELRHTYPDVKEDELYVVHDGYFMTYTDYKSYKKHLEEVEGSSKFSHLKGKYI